VNPPTAVGYIDIDHVVLPVPALEDALRQLDAWGLRAAPPQRGTDGSSDDDGTPIDGVRHIVFAAAERRNDLANMLVLVDAAPGRPAPPAPVLVCAAADLEQVRAEMERRGILAGDVEVVEPRVWIDDTTGTRFGVAAQRLAMRGSVPIAVNGTHAGELEGYQHRPWQRHPLNVRGIAGVSIAADDPEQTAEWLSREVFGRPVHGAGSGSLVLWPRDLFVRIVAGDGAARIASVTLLTEGGAGEDAPEPGATLRSSALPIEIEIIDLDGLARIPGWPGAA
jgi:Glyoxalase-like domain